MENNEILTNEEVMETTGKTQSQKRREAGDRRRGIQRIRCQR